MVKVVKTKNLGKSIMDAHNEGQRMDFGLTEPMPKALTVGPLFCRTRTKHAKKSRIQMEREKQQKIQDRIAEARRNKDYKVKTKKK